MNKADFHELILSMLSGNLIDVELSGDDIETAFKRACLVKRTKGNDNTRLGYYVITTTSGTRTYTLSTTETIDRIMQVIPIKDGIALSPLGPGVGYEFLTSGQLCYDPVLITLLQRQVEDFRKKYRSNIQFIHRRESNEIEFLKNLDGDVMLEVYYRPTDDMYRDDLWIQEWTQAECLIILGRAYSKFSSLSTPTGETSLNGQEMIQEGQDMKEKLLRDIMNHVDSMETVYGPIIIG